MSKYLPLEAYLARAREDRLPMTFKEVEDVLGFPLPATARHHDARWSYKRHNPAAQAWRRAGWRPTKVNRSAETVLFVREWESQAAQSTASRRVQFDLNELSEGARIYFQDQASHVGGLDEAVVKFLNREAPSPRRSLLRRFAAKSPRLESDSTLLIREDRDGR